MLARVLFDGRLLVDYGFIYVRAEDDETDWSTGNHRRGQRNGLCGAATPGMLHLHTGTNMGDVSVRVELHTAAPTLDEQWEEVVEVSFHSTYDVVGLHTFDGFFELSLPRGQYRVRYCARGMDPAHDRGMPDADQPAADSYLLQLWPAPPGPDRILRQTSEIAGYWHRTDRDVEIDPDQAAAESRHLADLQKREDLVRFGGRIPSDRLRSTDTYIPAFRALDEDLMWALDRVGDEVHREIARWAALRALNVAELASYPVVAAAVAALERAEPLGGPFAGDVPSYNELVGHMPEQDTMVPVLPWAVEPGSTEEQGRETAALYAVTATNDDDSLSAALNAIYSAAMAYGADDYPQFLDEIWAAFPQLGARGRQE